MCIYDFINMFLETYQLIRIFDIDKNETIFEGEMDDYEGADWEIHSFDPQSAGDTDENGNPILTVNISSEDLG